MKPKIYLRSLIKLAIAAFCLLITGSKIHAQNTFPATGAAGIGTNSPNASALLEIKSTSKGLLIPRMTLAQRNAIASPATGLLIYQTNSTPGFYYYDGSTWKAVTSAGKGWSLTGNAGTDSSINFIGTTDAHSLVFKVNNVKAGFIDNTTNGNTSLGYQGLLANTTGFGNTVMGSNSLKVNTIGSRNTAIGFYALVASNADNNTAIGTYALNANTSGTANVATGVNALQGNIGGVNNSAYGTNALYTNTTGQQNTATGYAALFSNSNGNYNSANGAAALNNNTNGSWNTANGAYTMYLNNSGYNNTAIGGNALYNNTTGFSNVAIGIYSLYKSTNASNLVAVGDSALYNQRSVVIGGEFPTYGDNTGVGSKALFGNTNGQRNTAVGSNALYNTQGSGGQASYNTGIGFQSLSSNVFGGNNTALGANADMNDDSRFNATSVGYGAIATADNQVMLGNTAVTSVKAAGSFVVYSDGRFKKNVKENVPGLIFINQLKPVTYNYDIHGIDKLIAPANSKKTNNVSQKINDAAIDAKERILYTGFVAQEVEAAAKKINYDFSGVYKPQNDKDAYGLSYSDFVVPLVKAVQELSKLNDDKDAKIDNLQKQINDLKALVLSGNSPSIQNATNAVVSNASLEQNIPNPFANTTTINYTLPQKFTTAQIIITDKTGKTLKSINVSGSGKGSLNVEASTLAAGAYNYSLIVDGKLTGSKQMILAK